MAKVTVKITPKAETTVTVEGAPGDSCYDKTRQLEAKLGKVVQDEKTHEYYEQAVAETEHATN